MKSDWSCEAPTNPPPHSGSPLNPVLRRSASTIPALSERRRKKRIFGVLHGHLGEAFHALAGPQGSLDEPLLARSHPLNFVPEADAASERIIPASDKDWVGNEGPVEGDVERHFPTRSTRPGVSP